MYMETEVRRGAFILDQKCPGWRKRVDLRKLNLTSPTNCVLGQLYGHYIDGGLKLGITDKPISYYGFAIPMTLDVYLAAETRLEHYADLTETWRTVIQEEPIVTKTFDPEPTVTPTNWQQAMPPLWKMTIDELSTAYCHVAEVPETKELVPA